MVGREGVASKPFGGRDVIRLRLRLEWSGGGRDDAIWLESRTGTYIISVWYFSAESHFSIIGCSPSTTLLKVVLVFLILYSLEREREREHEELKEMVC